MIEESLHDSTFAFRLLLQLIQMLGEQVSHGVRRFELEGEHTLRREDTQEYQYPMLKLLTT